jgi:subtilase family serine protease
VYLSPDPTCCAAATLLTAWNLATPVPAGGSYTMTRTVTIPNVAGGNYYLIVGTDISGLIYEADETNNTLARPITVTGPAPDLVPTAVTAPGSVSTQQAVSVSWTVKNQGTASASGIWTDTLYLSPSSVCCVGATPLTSVSVSPGTPAGASYTQTQTVTIPNVAAGGYYLIISTDAGNTRAETNEGNNQLAQALAVTTPDLMPTGLTAPPAVSPQQAVSVSWTVKNQGTGPAVGPWTDTLYISPNSSCCANATILKSVSPAPGTAAGATYTQTQTVTIPSLPVGPYVLFIRVDANGTLHEAGETNNDLSRPIRVRR